MVSGLKSTMFASKKKEPDHPDRIRIHKLNNEANDLVESEKRKNAFYRTFVPEWKRILIRKGNSPERAEEMTGFFSESRSRGNLNESARAKIAREKIISSMSRLYSK
jgi:hypothetical protein